MEQLKHLVLCGIQNVIRIFSKASHSTYPCWQEKHSKRVQRKIKKTLSALHIFLKGACKK
jgi:hypothetical protein